MITGKEKARNVFFILCAVLILVMKQHYSGPIPDLVKSYAGNISVSFAVYFIIYFSSHKWKSNKLITAVIALLIVELFEMTDGFGIMGNVYDPIDFDANLAGILFAYLTDRLIKVK